MPWLGLGGAGHSRHYPCRKEARRSCLEKEQNSMSRSICPLLMVALHTPAQRLEHVQPRGALRGARAHSACSQSGGTREAWFPLAALQQRNKRSLPGEIHKLKGSSSKRKWETFSCHAVFQKRKTYPQYFSWRGAIESVSQKLKGLKIMQTFWCHNFRFSIKFICKADAGQNRVIWNKSGMASRHAWNGLANEPWLHNSFISKTKVKDI